MELLLNHGANIKQSFIDGSTLVHSLNLLNDEDCVTNFVVD